MLSQHGQHNARANGTAERFVQTAVNAIRKRIQGVRRDWDIYVLAVQLAINTKVAALHQSTPFSLMFARAPNDMTDHSGAKPGPFNPDAFAERLAYMTDTVFPAIAERTQAVRERAAPANRTSNYPDGVGVAAGGQ